MRKSVGQRIPEKEIANFQLVNLPFESGEILFLKVFSIFKDIRKLQDKAKTSYTLSKRKLMLAL